MNSRPTSGLLLSGSRRNDLFAAALALLVIVADQLTKRSDRRIFPGAGSPAADPNPQ